MTRTTQTESAAALPLLLRHRHLLTQLLRRDIASRYRGSLLGIFWALLTPLLMLGVYSFIFGTVFRTRWQAAPQEAASDIAFPLLLYSGLIIHQFAAEILTRSTTIILHNSSYVKKVVFPLPILPVMVVLSAGFLALIQFILLFVAMGATGHSIPLTALWLPVIWAPLILLLCGGAWLVASVGVFLRDLSQIMGFLVTILLFLSPIFYPVTALPEPYRTFMQFNPLTPIIENTRTVLFYGAMPDWTLLGVYSLAALIICQCAYWWFKRTRKGFNDVL